MKRFQYMRSESRHWSQEKWPKFCRWHFQTRFLERESLYLDSNYIVSNLLTSLFFGDEYDNIGWDNGRTGDRPLSERMVSLLTPLCVTWFRWVKPTTKHNKAQKMCMLIYCTKHGISYVTSSLKISSSVRFYWIKCHHISKFFILSCAKRRDYASPPIWQWFPFSILNITWYSGVINYYVMLWLWLILSIALKITIFHSVKMSQIYENPESMTKT